MHKAVNIDTSLKFTSTYLTDYIQRVGALSVSDNL